MKAKQLALFPESSVYGYIHPVYRGCTSCAEESAPTGQVEEQQDESLNGGDDQ